MNATNGQTVPPRRGLLAACLATLLAAAGCGEGLGLRPVDPDDRAALQRLREDLAAGGDLAAPDADGLTPLHRAARDGHPQTGRFLLARGVAPDVLDAQGRTPLHLAAAGGRAAFVELLLDAGAPPDARDRMGRTPLHHASRAGQATAAEALIEAGAAPLAAAEEGFTALHHAAWNGHLRLAVRLIRLGAPPDGHVLAALGERDALARWAGEDPAALRRPGPGDTAPLHWAARSGARPVATWLIDRGAPASVPDASGRTPLDVAVDAAQWPLAERLIERGAEPGAAQTPASRSRRQARLTRAASRSAVCCRVLLDAGAEPDVPDAEGVYPLHSAVSAGRADTAALLIDRGARADQFAPALGMAPMHIAAATGADVLEVLLSGRRADVNLPDADGRTPLHHAVQRGDIASVKLLLAAGARMTKDFHGRTPLDYWRDPAPSVIVKTRSLPRHPER